MTFPNSPKAGTYLKDDFHSNDSVADGLIGELGWEVVTIANATTFTHVASQNGVVRSTTDDTAQGDGAVLRLDEDGIVLSGTNQMVRFLARYPAIAGNTLVTNHFQIGFSASVTAADGAVGIWAESTAGLLSLEGANTDTDESEAVAGVSTLTAVTAQGILTIAEPVTDGDQFTIASQEYRIKTTTAQAFDIAIGANEAASKVNIVAAINASGTEGVEYHAGTTANPDVSAATFVGDITTLTAVVAGTAGNALATTETNQGLTHASNIFNATTLGLTRSGTALGTAMVLGTWHEFMFVTEGVNANGGPATIRLYVDGELGATITGFLITSAETMELSIKHWQTAVGGDTLELDIDYLEVWLPRN